jgi:DNA-binding CsgD family transcriptional regulator
LAAPLAGAPEDASATAGPVFVGRQQDLALLRARLGKAISGEGQVVAIAGEPGIGKTRIAQVLAHDAGERAVAVLWGRCHEEPGSPPYWPWVQVLREYVTGHDIDTVRGAFGPSASELTGIVPQLAERMPFIPVTPTPSDAAQARFRVFEAVLASFKRAANAEPLLLVLDNVHWADTTSLRLLEFLAPEISATRLLVLITYRDIALSRRHPLSNSLAELARQPNFTRLRLRGLSASETAQFVAAASGQMPPSDVLANVHSQTEGNPLFIAEMTRYLVDEGVLGARGASASQTARSGGRVYRVPEGIKEAIGTRLNRLSAACNEVLAHAAVIGRVFRYDVLARLIDIDEREFAAALEEALAASVVQEMSERGACQFSHALIRETLYDELPATRRARLHLRVGAVLEAMGSGAATLDVAALAHHYCAALPGGDTGKAVHYAQLAAERANRLFAYEEAARYYRLAVQALESDAKSDPRERVRALIGVGEALTKAGSWHEAADVLEQAAGSAKAHGVAHELACAACAFEEASWRPGLPGQAAARLLRDALDAVGEDETTDRAEVLSSLSRALIFSGEVEAGLRMNAEAVAMARRLNAPSALEAALRAGLQARWLPAQFADRTAATLEVMRLARETGQRDRELEATSWRLFDLVELGDLPTFASVFDAYARSADELRLPFYQYVTLSSRSMLALFQGKFEEAEQWAHRGRAFGARLPTLDASGIFGVQMFSIRREQGRLKELAPVVAHFVRTMPHAAMWRPGLALVYSELGMKEEARAEFEVIAANRFAAVPRDGMWASCIAYLAEVCCFLGDSERAAELYAFLMPFDGRNIVAGPNVACSGAVGRHLGMLAAMLQRWTDAERHFEAALEMNARQGARPWLAHTRHRYAEMLLERGSHEDRDRALSMLDQALEEARAIGMTALAERASALREAPVAQPSRERYPAGLSRREVEVLRLIAAGKGNREIAERLFVSPNTVANHVRSILTKTNAANRTEAAAFALKNALVEE